MKNAIAFVFLTALLICTFAINNQFSPNNKQQVFAEHSEKIYWFELHRTSNVEYLYFGIPNNKDESQLLRTFFVKTGIPGERPTPLPEKLGREYWKIIKKEEATGNPETAPYFLTLDIPAPDEEPYGPVPYLECGGQCNWELPGYFGLHGVAGVPGRLSEDDEGSSGCIRHSDGDITYLYNLLEPEEQEIRYYVRDI